MTSRRGLLALACVATASCAAPTRAPIALVDRVKVGAFVQRAHHAPDRPSDVERIEDQIGVRFDIINDYLPWGAPLADVLSDLYPRRELMVSWKPDSSNVPAIAQGAQDSYIDSFADDVREYGAPVHVRFAFEMNGSWNSYSSGAAGGPAATTWIMAWRRIVDKFRARRATNARFVWAPNETDVPNVEGNHLEDYWPGRQHVDVLGFDAYNWSDQEPRRGDGRYRTFEQIVEGPYQRLLRLPGAPGLPVWLTEFGTTETNTTDHTKADWFTGMFASRRFAQLQAIVYFSQDDRTETRRDWRLDSSAESLRAFAAGLSRRT